jgi:GT2 family glycosyltransferase
MPLMSVVIPTHDRWPSLGRLLASLARQVAPPNFEIVVVDDGSAMACPISLEGEGSRVRLLRQVNAGRSAARNRGAAEARGDVLVFLDDDMEVAPSFLRDHADARRDGAEILGGAVRLPTSCSATPFGRFRLWLERAHEPPEAARTDGPVEIDGLSAQNFSMSREVFLRLGGFDERLTNPGCEDYELHLRAVACGHPTRYAQWIVAVHHDEFADLQSYARRERDYARGWMQLVALRPEVLTQAPRFARLCLNNDPGLHGLLGARVRLKALVLDCGMLGALHDLAAFLARIDANEKALRQVYLRILSLEAMVGYREGLARFLGNRCPLPSPSGFTGA